VRYKTHYVRLYPDDGGPGIRVYPDKTTPGNLSSLGTLPQK